MSGIISKNDIKLGADIISRALLKLYSTEKAKIKLEARNSKVAFEMEQESFIYGYLAEIKVWYIINEAISQANGIYFKDSYEYLVHHIHDYCFVADWKRQNFYDNRENAIVEQRLNILDMIHFPISVRHIIKSDVRGENLLKFFKDNENFLLK